MKSLPNILTSLRLVLALFMFIALAASAGAVPGLADRLTPEAGFSLQRWAVYAFVIAAVTDFFDGWLARKMNATSIWGAILDPIGDKVLVCGAVLGLMSLGAQPMVLASKASAAPKPRCGSSVRPGNRASQSAVTLRTESAKPAASCS